MKEKKKLYKKSGRSRENNSMWLVTMMVFRMNYINDMTSIECLHECIWICNMMCCG